MKNIYRLIFAFLATCQITAQDFNGYWEAQGTGLFLEVSTAQVDLYSYNSISLVPIGSLPLDSNFIGTTTNPVAELSIVNDLLNLSFFSTVDEVPILFEQRSSIPAVTTPTKDPVKNFDIFWTTFEEYCSLFSIIDVDWQAQYDLYRPQIDQNTSDSLLFVFMGNMIKELNDGHCFLVDQENQRFVPSGDQSSSTWAEYSDVYFDLLDTKYLDLGSFQPFTENFSVVAATIAEGEIGYLMISSFEIWEDNSYKDNVFFEDILDEVFEYLENTESLIIDVRNNGGGHDSNARILGNRLSKTTQTAYSITNRLKESYDSFTAPVSLSLTPSERVQYIDRPVMLLTSNLSASATESLAMLAKEIDCVTTVGDTTEGIFSNIFIRSLPNKWVYALSTQFFLDVDGVNHEQVGIVPDIYVAEDLEALLQDDIDTVLEYAIGNVGSSCQETSVSELEKELPFSVYPNPFAHRLIIDTSFDVDVMGRASIYNVVGELVHNQRLENKNEIELSQLPHGLYTVVVETTTQKLSTRVLKLEK